jgi:cobalt/nickel transport protein
MNKFRRKLITGLVLLVLLSPLGLILPSIFNSGEPWGEASGDKVRKELGYTPAGMKKNENIWKAPVKDYILGKEKMSVWGKSITYIGSGLLGVGIIAFCTFWLNKFYRHNE